MKLFRGLEDMMVAATFAEKNQHDYAQKVMLKGAGKKQTRQFKTKSDQKIVEQPRMRM